MAHHDVLEQTRDDLDVGADREEVETFVDFLQGEFPDWEFAVDTASTWSGDPRPLWIATQVGHHPQSELTAGKLHRRLSDYEAREAERHAATN